MELLVQCTVLYHLCSRDEHGPPDRSRI